MIQQIVSLQNPVVKATAELKNKKNRQERQAFFLEGKRAMEEALTSGWEIISLFSTKEEELDEDVLAQTGASGYLVTEAVMGKMASTEHPQSCGAVMRQKQGSLSTIENKDGLVLVLDGVMDPGNLGTIIRTADGAGALSVVLLDNSVDLFNPKVVRATMGSLFHLPIITGFKTEDLIDFCAKEQRPLWATSLKGAVDYHAITWPKRLALLMGNEARGVSPTLLEQAAQKIYIPMAGRAESLNVAVAAGILLFAYGQVSCQSK